MSLVLNNRALDLHPETNSNLVLVLSYTIFQGHSYSAFDPLLYFYSSQRFRKFLVRMLKCKRQRLKSRKENPQKLTQLSSRSHPRHLVGKRTAQKDTIIDITSDSQVNSNFPYKWSPASLTFNNYFYLFLYLNLT